VLHQWSRGAKKECGKNNNDAFANVMLDRNTATTSVQGGVVRSLTSLRRTCWKLRMRVLRALSAGDGRGGLRGEGMSGMMSDECVKPLQAPCHEPTIVATGKGLAIGKGEAHDEQNLSSDSTNDHILKAYSVLPVWSRTSHVKEAAFRWNHTHWLLQAVAHR
jgi:hypothetical protein